MNRMQMIDTGHLNALRDRINKQCKRRKRENEGN